MLVALLLLGTALELGPAVSYGEDARAATIAVSEKGRVSLAVATKEGLELVDVTSAAGPQRRWTLPGPVAASGEDRPQLFFQSGPVIVAFTHEGDLIVSRPEGTGNNARIPGGAKGRECVAAAFATDGVVLSWTEGGALKFSTPQHPGVVTVDERVCPCCRPAIAFAPPATTVWVAYRDERDGIRDLYVRKRPVWGEPFGEPVRVSTEGYASKECPMAGPAAAALDEKTVVLAYVLPGSTPKVKLAVSADGAGSFAPAIDIAIGTKPQLHVLGARRIALAWDGVNGGVFATVSDDAFLTWSAPQRVDAANKDTVASGVAISATPGDANQLYVSYIEKKGEKRAVSARKITVSDVK
jgi:hypothetical protein